jgi:chromosomal replication initiator protein
MTEAQQIRLAVANFFNITIEQMDSRARPDYIVWPRMIAMALIREKLQFSYPHIGLLFKKDRGTAMYAKRAVKNRAEVEPTFKTMLDSLRNLFDHIKPRHILQAPIHIHPDNRESA